MVTERWERWPEPGRRGALSLVFPGNSQQLVLRRSTRPRQSAAGSSTPGRRSAPSWKLSSTGDPTRALR